MTVTAASLVGTLRQFDLLPVSQLQELERRAWPEARALGKDLLLRGWLTSFQVNCLLQERGAELALGPYVLLERLGEGGKGQVYKARHRSMNRLVALKVLRKELASDPEAVGRFHREMEVLSHISHPHLVHAFDAGPIGSSLVLAMEYVEGVDLERHVKTAGALPPGAAAEYIRQAALGLQHAHERGLIHRDIKPANLLLAKGANAGPSGKTTLRVHLPPWAVDGGVVKVLDLGLARLRQTEMKSATANLTLDYGTSVTQGTPDYMAPEQAIDFHTADIRADIYSLGCTLFFLLTGAAPFASGSLAQKLMKHQQAEPPDLRALRPDVPVALVKIANKMQAKRPEERYQTPGEVADALAALFTSGPLKTGAARTVLPAQGRARKWTTIARRGASGAWTGGRALGRFAWRRPKLALLGAVLLLAGLAVLLLPGTRPGASLIGMDSSEQAALRRLLELLYEPDVPEAKVLDRLNRFDQGYPGALPRLRAELLAVGLRQPGSLAARQAGVWLTYLPSPLDQLDARQIPEKKRFPNAPPELIAILGEVGPAYSRVAAVTFRPDCQMLAYTAGNADIYLWDLRQGAPRIVPLPRSHGSYVMSLAFSPDGKWLASGGGDNSAKGDNNIRLWNVTQPEVKVAQVLAGHVSTVNTLAFAPDGRWLTSSGEDRSVRAWQPGQSESVVLLPQVTYVHSLAFAPDGGTLAIAGTYWQAIRLLTFTPPQPGKTVDLKYTTAEFTNRIGYAPDGTMLAATSKNQIVLWDPIKLTEIGRLNGHTAEVRDLAFAPDSRSLLSGESAPDGQGNVNEPDGRIIRWNLSTRQPAAEWRLPCGGIKRLALASDGRHLAIGGRNSMVYIFRLAAPKVGR